MTRFACTLSALALSVLSLADTVWLEGEQPERLPAGAQIASVEKSDLLSGTKWLSYAVDSEDAKKSTNTDGARFDYPISIQQGGNHEVWARIGFEFARSQFEWRIDEEAWHTVSPDDLTTDMNFLGTWTEVGWLKLGSTSLTSGPHQLQFRVPLQPKGRTLFALDAAVITDKSFIPNGKRKPEEHADLNGTTKFTFPEADGPHRSQIELKGTWQVCRDDEQLPGEVAAPIRDLPKQPQWRTIRVPFDKNRDPELMGAHRIWYRTTIDVPKSQLGRSFALVFPANSLNTTVYVNGQFIGFEKSPFVRIQMDATPAIHAGINEVMVGIKDVWYARASDPNDPMKLRRTFNLPMSWFTQGWQEFVYPVWNQSQSGILGTPLLLSAGSTYAADIFVKPSVRRRVLDTEISLTNNGPTRKGQLLLEAVDPKTGKAEKTFPPIPFDLSAGETKTISSSAPWDNPRLWWPTDPQMTTLRTTVTIDGKVVDVVDTPFGFREWTWDSGKNLKLNGVRWQGFSEGLPAESPEEAAATARKRNIGFLRMWAKGDDFHFWGLEPDKAFARLDTLGLPVRYTGYCDGEMIGYTPAILPQLGPNWIDQLKGWVKSYRNHPSIFMWSIENEMTFINARNVGQLDTWEPIVTKAWQAVHEADPTRPAMVDGGGALRSNTLPIAGEHYTTKPFWNYPQLAYESNAQQDPWLWDQKRPKFIGEELFAAGINPAYAYFGGESTFLGKVASRVAVGKAMQVISQGYRWFGLAGCDFCQGPGDGDGSYYNSWAPRAVFVRQWDWTFASGQKATRTFGVFNNTPDSSPLTFTWTISLAGKKVSSTSEVHPVKAGGEEKFDRVLTIPVVNKRIEGTLVLTLSANGKEVFRDTKLISVLPSIKPSVSGLYVYDPEGTAKTYLKTLGVSFTLMSSLTAPPTGKVWLIGKNALPAAQSSSSMFSDYALGGGKVVMLEQEHPLRFQGLNPAEAEADTNLGRTAFVEDASHPILAGLRDKDFFTWEPGEIVYRNAYLKPTKGAKSLLQCAESLTNSALMVIPVGQGEITLCQAVVTENLKTNATARTLFSNLLSYASTYRLQVDSVAAAITPEMGKVLDAINLRYTRATSPLDALTKGKVAIISATPSHLKALAAALPKVRQFTSAGGTLVLHGLTPEGLADYNKLVGYSHMIRPFRREHVQMAMPKNPLLSGVSVADVALYSAQPIFSWQSGNYIASDTFSYLVDSDEVAPFGKWDNEFHLNLVNGMVSADGWPYIVNEPNDHTDYSFVLPTPQTLCELSWTGNTFYNTTSKIKLIVDGKEVGTYAVKPTQDTTTITINPPVTGTRITIRHAEFTDLPDKGHTIGCDNITLRAVRSDGFASRVRPMLNVGGLVDYPQGKGHIILCNVLFKEQEDVPANATHKRAILSAILRNLRAPFTGKTVIAGSHLTYTPIDISKKANQYRTDRGWFGDSQRTFKDLPTGAQTFAGVKFNVFEMPTSPVPTAIMLGGNGVPNGIADSITGIKLGLKADALFFLHTARVDQPKTRDEVRDHKRFEVAQYLVHYADGTTEQIPIFLGEDIDHYVTGSPMPLPGAQMAWAKRYEGTNEYATAYSKQWTNPKPAVVIDSIDLLYGRDRRAIPALLALTAATAR